MARDLIDDLLERWERARPGLGVAELGVTGRLSRLGQHMADRDDGVFGLEAPLPEPTGRIALATGEAGDVYLCHPFLVHAASWPHRGTQPRFVAQPPISITGDLLLDGDIGGLSPVARAVRTALDTA